MLSTDVRMTKGNRVRRMQNFLLACGALQEHRALSFAAQNHRRHCGHWLGFRDGLLFFVSLSAEKVYMLS